MSNIDKIKAEIERRREANKRQYLSSNGGMSWQRMCGEEDCLVELLAFIDSLPDENNPEPYNPVYDEDYLNEKIAKATKSWEGVDVNKMLADCRGYEEESSYVTDSPGDPGNPGEPGISDLEEAADDYADKHGFRVPYDGSNNYYDDVDVKASKEGFIAGAEWMRKKDVEDMYMSDNRHFLKCYEQGKVDMKVEMMKGAIHYIVQDDLDSHGVSYNIPFIRIGRVALEPKGIGVGDKVKIIIVKQ